MIGTKLVELPYIKKSFEKLGIENPSCLIVGEPQGTEGVIQTVLELTNNIVCTDIQPSCGYIKELENESRIKFIQTDFVNFDESQKFDIVVCVSVLEHFGMIFQGKKMYDSTEDKDNIIKWNHDLVGIQKMCNILKEGKSSRVCITVPCGPFFNFEENGNPFLRSYDYTRIKVVKNFIKSLNCNVQDEMFYYSKDYVEWYETDETISYPHCVHLHLPTTPNSIWAFNITK